MGGITLAFKDFKYALGIFKSPWCGWDNFRYLFVTGKIWSLTRNTLLYNIAFIFLGLIFEVGFAILLSEINNKLFKKFAQGFMFLPYFISWVVVSTVMLNIFGANGVLNSVLAHFGITGFSIYKQVKQWPIVLVLVRLWKQTGYGTVVYLAAIAGISKDLYEAAAIDGASVWQKIRYITLPSLKPTVMVMVLLSLGNVFRGDFGMFYQLVGLFALACLLPFYLIIVGSFTAESSIIKEGYSFFLTAKKFSTEAYKLALKNPQSILHAYGVTIFVTVVGTVLSIFMTTMTGYVLSRPDFPWRNGISFFFFFTTLFSGGLVPWYLLCTQYLHFNNHLLTDHSGAVFRVEYDHRKKFYEGHTL